MSLNVLAESSCVFAVMVVGEELSEQVSYPLPSSPLFASGSAMSSHSLTSHLSSKDCMPSCELASFSSQASHSEACQGHN